jgi:uncharacterized protein
MSEENVEIIRRGYELYTAGDLEAVAALFSDDAVVSDTAGLGTTELSPGTRRGPQGFVRVIEEARDAFEDFRTEPEDFIDAGEVVIVPARISGRGRASGAKQEAHLVHLWALRDGKVIRAEIYRTVEEALEAAGAG